MAKDLLPLACFGNIQYYAALLTSDEPVIEMHENFIKQSFRSRYQIAGPNGRMTLTVPRARSHKDQTPIHEIRISYDERWQSIHWRSLEAGYRSSPYFEYYEDELRPLFTNKTELLVDYNLEAIKFIFEQLQEPLNITKTETYEANPENTNDLRTVLMQRVAAQQSDYEIYPQLFEERTGFIPNLSILDLLFNLGPNAASYLRKIPLPKIGS